MSKKKPWEGGPSEILGEIPYYRLDLKLNVLRLARGCKVDSGQCEEKADVAIDRRIAAINGEMYRRQKE